MIDEIARGLGLRSMNDPPPGPGVVAGLSGSGYVDLGAVELVPSLGIKRWATFREIYLTNPWVWASVNLLARGIQRTPIGAFALDADGFAERQRGDIPQGSGPMKAANRLDYLLGHPSAGVSRSSFWGGISRDKLVYGNALGRLDRTPAGGMPIGMRRVPWRKLNRVHTDASDAPLFYEMHRKRGDVEPERLLPIDVVHFGLYSDEGAIGVSPLMACRATLALHDAVMRHMFGYLKNYARTTGHLYVEKLNADKAREIRELIAEMYASPENAGKILVTSGQWQQTSDSPGDAQILELLQESRVEVAAAYMIPQPVLGILDRAIKSNVEQLRTQYIREPLATVGGEITDDLDAQLVPQTPLWDGLSTRCIFDELLLPDPENLALYLQRLGPYMTMDEGRSKLNLKPLKISGISDRPWAIPGSNPVSSWEPGGKNAGGGNGASTPIGGRNGHSAKDSADLVHTITARGEELESNDV